MGYFQRILVLPVGSYEYHGEKLPPNMDALIAMRVTATLVERIQPAFAGVVKALPVLNYGLSLEHIGLPNTAYVLHTTYYTFLTELLDSIAVDRDLLVIVNGHGGNVNTLAAIEADFNYQHRQAKLFVPSVFPKAVKQLSDQLFGEFDAHAGSVEASLYAFYEGGEATEYVVELPKKVRGTFRFFRTADMSPHGVIKQNPTVIADPQRGERLHSAVVEDMTASVLRFTEDVGAFLSD